tara:strand:+ start:6898 stop:7500 length:603 start_codon:yes stop_codon:yes gene_type:complete
MHKIAAFIEFDKKIEDKILFQKKIIKKKYGKQIYLNHPVHLTLFTLNIKKISELKKVYVNKDYRQRKPILIRVTKGDVFFNDPITNGHTIFYHIQKNDKLNKIQIKHLRKINNKIEISKKENYFKIPILNSNYEKFGFPFWGKIWIPHVTIASIRGVKKNDNYIKKFKLSKVNLECQINKIKFYKIKNDKHQFLFSVKNF